MPENIFGKEVAQQSGFMQSSRIRLDKVLTTVWKNITLRDMPKCSGFQKPTLNSTRGNEDSAGEKHEKPVKCSGCSGFNPLSPDGMTPQTTTYVIKKAEYYKKDGVCVKHRRERDLTLNSKKTQNKPSDKKDKSESLLNGLNIVAGEKGRIDCEQLLTIYNNSGFTTAEAIEAIEKAGGIKTERPGRDAVYDFTSSLGVK